MKYYTHMPKFSPIQRRKRLEFEKQFTALDRAVLQKASTGDDVMGLWSACRPYVGKHGEKSFASLGEVQKSVRKLLGLSVLRSD